MSNRFKQGMDRLIARMGTFAQTTIVYHRGDSSVIITDAWIGRTAYRISDQLNGSRLEFSERDYLIPVVSLVIDSQTVVPEENDWIEISYPDPNESAQWELMSVNDEKAWRYSDQTEKLFRVHTKARQ